MRKRGGAVGLLVLLLLCAACSAGLAPPGGSLPSASAGSGATFPENIPPQPAGPLQNLDYDASVQDMDFGVEEIYITVYPTYSEDGELMTRAVFDLHTALDRSFNPTLNAHIWEGNPADPTDTDTRFGFDGPEVNSTIRVRGGSSRGFTVKNFKVKLTEEGAKLFGTDSLNFNKHLMDDTRTNNKLVYDLLQLMPTHMSSLRTKFIRLYFNDVAEDGSETGFVDQGLYIWIEQPDRNYLINHGLDPNGALYKPDVFEFRRYPDQIRSESDPLYSEEIFSSVIKPMVNPDHDKLIRMLEAVNDYSIPFGEVMDTYFDEENYLAWMAVNLLVGNTDALTHNYLLYSPSNSEKWYFLPWDYDESFEYAEVNEWGSRHYQNYGVHVFWGVPFHQRYLRLEGSAEKLRDWMIRLHDELFTAENLAYLNGEYLKVLTRFYSAGPDTDMALEFHLGRLLVSMEIPEHLWDDFWVDSFWFRVRAAEDRFAEFFPRRVAEPISLRYAALENNYRRFLLTLECPTAGYIQEPERTADGWLFRWDAAYDFQQDSVTYELIVARDIALTDVLYHETGIRANELTVPDLPPGQIYYRFITRDARGNEQYPLNVVVTRVGGVSSRVFALAEFTVPAE